MDNKLEQELKNISEEYKSNMLFPTTSDEEYLLLVPSIINQLKNNSPEAFLFASSNMDNKKTFYLNDSLRNYSINVYKNDKDIYSYLVEVYIKNKVTTETAIVYEEYDGEKRMYQPIEVVNMGINKKGGKQLIK